MNVPLFHPPFFLLPRLPFAYPIHQRPPVRAYMLSPKPCHASQFLVLNLDCHIGLAHQTLPNKVEAVSNVWRGRHHRHLLDR